MIIGVADNYGSEEKYQLYVDWLLRGDPATVIKKISYRLDNLTDLNSCDGVLLTGGGDVDPALYGGDVQHPAIYGVDQLRDDFERKIIDRALKHEIPFLGICRGLQLTNVHFGGTLIQDLTEYGHPQHSVDDPAKAHHGIVLERQSSLFANVQLQQGLVNTYHHQAVDVPGKGLKVVARSDDGIVEAMELADERAYPFFLLVQWHPERMKEFSSVFTKNIFHSFASAMQRYQQQQ